MSASATKYHVKARKVSENGDVFYKEVGVVLINGDGTGVLHLHVFDKPFRLFSEEYYERRQAEEKS